MDYDVFLNKLINDAIIKLNNFESDFKNEDFLNEYFDILYKIFNLLDNPNIVFANELSLSIKNEFESKIFFDNNYGEENNIITQRKSFTFFLLKNSQKWRDKIDYGNETWATMDEFIVVGTVNEYNKKFHCITKTS